MDAVNAFPLSDIDGVQITDDGMQMLLHAKDGSGRDVVLAIRNDRLMHVLALTAIAQRRSERLLKVDPQARPAFDATGCELLPGANAQESILSVGIEGDGRFSFHLERDHLLALQAAVQARLAAG